MDCVIRGKHASTNASDVYDSVSLWTAASSPMVPAQYDLGGRIGLLTVRPATDMARPNYDLTRKAVDIVRDFVTCRPA